MKPKYIILIALSACMGLGGCEDFLDTTDYMSKNDGNFPLSIDDIQQELTGCYSLMAHNMDLNSSFYTSDILSDDRFGGGGGGDIENRAKEKLLKVNNDMYNSTWSNLYVSVFNTNKLIENTEKVIFDNEDQKNYILGQVHFLRAFAYMELTRLFGEVPLNTTSLAQATGQASADELHAFIASDLKKSIELLPSIKHQNINPDDLGRVTKWAAQAFMAREFLFYTGYYQKESLPLHEGGAIEKSQVVSYLEDCISNSGHALLPDFRSNWPYGNIATRDDYNYTKENNIVWAEENGSNYETVFAIKYGVTASWSDFNYNNTINVYCSMRGQGNYANCFPFGEGWGFGTVNPGFWKDWELDEPKDIRRKGSIINVDDPDEGIKVYVDGGGEQMEDTHLWCKKYAAITSWKDQTKTEVEGYSCKLYGTLNDFPFFNTQDLVLMRFSDILLMYSELTETIQNLNIVRNRVGLPPVEAYSREAIEKERRYELAMEGVRYYDLLRWYQKEAGKIIDKNQNGHAMKDNRVDKIYHRNLEKRIRETGGFLQIPQRQIDLTNHLLKQNPGWDTNDIQYEEV